MAIDLTGKKRNFMVRYTQAAQAFLAARNALVALKSEWDASGYSSGIVQGDIQDPQLLHLTPTILGNGFVSQQAVETTLASGHLTNLNALVGM